MRVLRLALSVVLFLALPLFAREVPTINSINPSSVHMMSGEWFVTITGTHYLPLSGVNVTFNGPAGVFTLAPNAGTDTEMFVWVPLPVTNVPGTYTVTVSAGQLTSNPAAFTVISSTVVLKVPIKVLAEATSLQGAIAQFDVTATSEFGETTYIDCSHRSGELFPFDITTIDCYATDDFGGEAKASFDVQVADTTPPSIEVPRDITIFGSKEGATVKYDVKATDVVDPEVRVDCSPASDSLFRVGTSTINCSSFDRFKNEGIAKFRVHVGSDDTPALIVPLSFAAEATSRDGASVSYEVSATDVKGGSIPVECDPKSGSQFPLGVTTVKCSATAGLTQTETFDITVADTTAPALSLPGDFTVQASAFDGEFVTYSASAKDAVEGESGVSCFPESGSFFAPGTTTVNCTASDKSRNEAAGSFVVTVLPLFDDTVYARTGGGKTTGQD
jgi:hypothetical protein